MKRLFFLFILFSLCNCGFTQQKEIYSEVKVYITSAADIKTLQEKDIDAEHFVSEKDGIKLVINSHELTRLKSSGLRYDILIANTDDYYNNRPTPRAEDMFKSRIIQQADNVMGYMYGSMGGFYTYNELVQKLDSMRTRFPNLITAKKNIGTTAEGRTIWAIKISDNPDANESGTESAVYFDALHHAREPIALHALVYYMYWLMENYGTDPEATYLVNNREIYFVPIANPDGYAYNQSTNPTGGGMWRKNRRNNGSGCYGVDLNRNYPFGWGLNTGSSNDPCSETYRGPSAGSEPESQAIKRFCDSIHASISFSTHSVAGRYLNPYGYNDSAAAYDIYSEFASDFSSENDYLYGTVIEMLNYYSSGTTRDYLHSIGTYCWTPEMGGSGFWPLQSEIIPVCSENLYGLKYLSWVAGASADFQNHLAQGKGYVTKNDTLKLQIGIKNKGLKQYSRNVSVTISTPYANASVLNSTVNYDSIAPRTVKQNSASPFRIFVNNSANIGDEMKVIVTTSQEGVVTSKDTISMLIGAQKVLVNDNAESGTSKWVKSGSGIQWDTTFVDSYSPVKSFTDSRYGNSRDNTTNYFTLTDTINLIGAINPKVEFAAKWAIEKGYDYARFQISTNNGSSWVNLSGKYTSTMSGQPSYTGNQSWVRERFNLNPYIGQRIRIRFNYYTDSGTPGDGFYFDDFKVVDYRDSLTGIVQSVQEVPLRFALSQNYPNPFNPETVISYQLAMNSNVTLRIFDMTGREAAILVNGRQNAGTYQVTFNGSNFSSGVYYYTITAGEFTETKRMMLVK